MIIEFTASGFRSLLQAAQSMDCYSKHLFSPIRLPSIKRKYLSVPCSGPYTPSSIVTAPSFLRRRKDFTIVRFAAFSQYLGGKISLTNEAIFALHARLCSGTDGKTDQKTDQVIYKK
ncbi:MAG: hypothetical protein RI563_10145 [Thiohalophilus sp.]|nr:hypothetical protein [Thiohalophilus sp.]